MSFVNFIFFGISFVVLAISGGFSTNSAVRITGIPSWDDNPKLKSAHSKLSIAAIITWITVAVILILGILYIIFGSETIGIFGNIIIYLFLLLTLAATAAVGALSAIGASDIQQSKVTNDNGARKQAIIASVLAIVGFVGLVIILIIRLFNKPKETKDTGLMSLGEDFGEDVI